MSLIWASVQVSILALGVIFLVLSILIGVIELLVYLLPYKETAAKPLAKKAPAAASDEEAHVAAIHATLAHHQGKSPRDLKISNIRSG